MSSRASDLALLSIVAASVALGLLVVTPAISLDDPFIGLRYARHLVAGHGLVFNAGEAPVEGYTAFLWVVLASLGISLGFEPLGFWQVLGVLGQVATLLMIYRLGWRSDRARGWALLAPALLGVHVSFVAYPMLGMETAFFTGVVTLAVLMVALEVHATRRGALLLGMVLLAVCLIRFDGFGLAGLVFAWVLLVERRGRSFVWAFVPFLLGMLVYNGWRLAYYGDPLPNTFYAKSFTWKAQLAAGLSYLWRFAWRGGPAVLVVASPLLLWRRGDRIVRLCAWMAGGHLAYVVLVGGDWMPYYRFVLPVLPLLYILLQESVWGLSERLRERGAHVPLPVRGLAVAALVGFALLPLAASTFVRKPPPGRYWHPEEARSIGRHLSDRLPEDALVAVEWAGIIPFYMRQPVLDIFGLSDKEITTGPFPGSRMGRAVTPEFVVERRPDLVIYAARYSPTAEAAAGMGPEIRGEGLWITGFFRSLLEAQYGYSRCVLDMGRDRYWPVLVRDDFAASRELCVGP